jgi:hypothetical protein
MLPGTIPRRSMPPKVAPDSAEKPSSQATPPEATLPIAPPVRGNVTMSRRDYFRSLVPSLGSALVKSLRTAGNIERDIEEALGSVKNPLKK